MQEIDISLIRGNEDNPRTITEDKFKQLVKSIRDFPQMLKLRPLVLDKDKVVLGGNMRLRACIELGYKTVPVIYASELTDEQKREFIIKDNLGFGAWDWDMLANEWEVEQLQDWGMDIPDFKNDSEEPDSSEYNTRFEIAVECTSEREQEKLYEKLTADGYKCRVLTL